MAKQIKLGLESIQLQHWMRAVAAGKLPTTRNTETGELVSHSLPFARTDGGGLTFTLSAAGTASWILRYRYGGRAKEVTLGNYPDMSLNEARRLAREKRVEIDKGVDPATEKRKAKAQAMNEWTMRVLCEDYRAKVLCDLSLNTQRSYTKNIEYLESHFGSYKVSQITPIDVVTFIEKLKLTWTMSNMLLCVAKAVFRHAVGKKIIVMNPCAGIELSSMMGRRPAIRKRLMLTEGELLQLFSGKISRENLLAIKVLLGTAARSGELITAKWSDFDFESRIWKLPTSKTGAGADIPLSDAVLGWLHELKKLAIGSAYVLPARRFGRKERNGGDAHINRHTLGESIVYWIVNHKPDIRQFTPHDLRSTAKSQMRSLGIARDITEMCLNHKLPGVEGIYDVHTYFEERKAALEILGGYLKEIEIRAAGLSSS